VKRALAPVLLAAEDGDIPEAKRAVWHCAVVPCLDKKLEGSRSELRVDGSSSPESDCVVTAGELHELVRRLLPGGSLTAARTAPLDSLGDLLSTALVADAVAQPHAECGLHQAPARATQTRPLFAREADFAARGALPRRAVRGAAPPAAAGAGVSYSHGYVEGVARRAAARLFNLTLPQQLTYASPGAGARFSTSEVRELTVAGPGPGVEPRPDGQGARPRTSCPALGGERAPVAGRGAALRCALRVPAHTKPCHAGERAPSVASQAG
jgi:hypothetical protein